MAIEKVLRTSVLIHRDEFDAALEAIQREAVLHVDEVEEIADGDLLKPLDADVDELEERIREVEEAMSALERYLPPKGTLEALFEPPLSFSFEERDAVEGDASLREALSRVRELLSRMEELERREKMLKERRRRLAFWRRLSVPPSQLKGFRRVSVLPCEVDTGSLEPVRAFLAECEEKFPFDYEVVETSQAKQAMLLFCLKENEKEVVSGLVEAGGELFELGGGSEPVEVTIEDIDGEIARTVKEYQRCEDMLRGMTGVLPRLRLLADVLLSRRRRMEARSRLARTEKVVCMQGWVLEDRKPRLEEVLSRTCGTYDVEFEEPSPDSEPPVSLRNGELTTPFEMITALYSYPHYREIDPTPLLAPFFAFFFGVCLSEAGYGLLMVLASWFALRKIPMGPESKRFMKMICILGLVTIVIGLGFGGFFGIDFDTPGSTFEFLKPVLGRLRVINPNTDQVQFFMFVLVLGFIQVSYGFLVKAYMNYREGKIADILYDQFSWLFMMFGAAVGVMVAMGILGQPWLKLMWALLGLGAFLILFFSGREIESFPVRIAQGAYSLYGITGILGDILSYSRLLALGMATGVIAGVVNTIAAMCLDIPYGVGVVLMLVILVVGHVMNLLISALGAFVHSVRLQFVEFFNKFYEGGGEPFSPLVEEMRYTIVKRKGER